jgi:hypothetical protein
MGLSKTIAVDVHNVHNSQTWEKMDWGCLDVQVVSEHFHKHHLFENPCSALLKWPLEESWHRGWLGVRLEYRRTVERIEGDLGLDSALASCSFAIAEPRREVYCLDLRVSCQQSSFSRDVGIIEESQATEVSVSITSSARGFSRTGFVFRFRRLTLYIKVCLVISHVSIISIIASCLFIRTPSV